MIWLLKIADQILYSILSLNLNKSIVNKYVIHQVSSTKKMSYIKVKLEA